MFSLFMIAAANLFSRLVVVLTAAYISFRVLSRWAGLISHFACGLLLSVACTLLIPEAFAHGVDPSVAGGVFLVSFFVFIALDRVLSLCFGHQHGLPKVRAVPALLGGGVSVTRSCASHAGARAYPMLVGAACHNAVDGVLIAAAFMIDFRSGLLVTAAVFAHEVPQVVGQMVVLTQGGVSQKNAVWFCLAAASAAVFGGVAGWGIFEHLHWVLPYAMLVSAASFLFVVLAVLVPEFCHDEDARPAGAVRDITALLVGALLSWMVLLPLHESMHAVVEGEEHMHVESDGHHDHDDHKQPSAPQKESTP